MMWAFGVYILGVILIAQVHGQRESRIVEIDQGLVRGYKDEYYDVFAFNEIPYASARNRFETPSAPPSWMGIFEAVERGIVCPQRMSPSLANAVLLEDCLVTNIAVPNTEETNLPVLVSVHGGAFQGGEGTWDTFKTLSQEQNIITVNFNYRVGVFGFLCLGTKDVPGNAGLKDQLALLRWVKRNIAKFGGNPDDVTIRGCSAGSALMDILTLSPTTRGLFHRSIGESGSHIGAIAVQGNPIENAKHVARRLNFENVDNITALEEFYKTAPMELLTSINYSGNRHHQVYTSACIEKDLGQEAILLDAPYNILKSGDYVRYPTMYGFTDMEASERLHLFDTWKHEMNEKFSDFLPGDLQFENEEQKEQVAKDVQEFYFGDKPVSEETILSYLDYVSDVLFGYGMMRSVKAHAEAGNFTFYLYQYTFTDSNTPPIPYTNVTRARHCYQHFAVGDEDETNITQEYRYMKRIMRELWGNFIKTGVPVTGNTTLPSWPPTSGNRSPHMYLGASVELKGILFEDRAHFWDNIYDRYYRVPIPPSPGSASAIKSVYVIYSLIIAYLLS